MKKQFLLLLLLISALHLHAQETEKTFRVYFDHDSYALSDTAQATLDSIVPYSKGFSSVSISVFGYTDDSGTMDYNKILAADRANAAKGYLEAKGLTVGLMDGKFYTEDKPATPERQRRAVITIKGENTSSAGSGYGMQEFTGPGGTIVIANVANGSEGAIEINEFFTPDSMIANDMYAVGVDGSILQTAGMIEICRDNKKLDPDGQSYTVKIPARPGRTINGKMTVWLQVKGDNGIVEWQNTPIEITTDAEKKYYIFQVPAGTQDCIRVNLDMPCYNGKAQYVGNPVAVYIETVKPYDFFTVGISRPARGGDEGAYLPFSAKLKRTLWVFTADESEDVRNMVFYGRYWENGGQITVGMSLKRAKYTYNKKDHSHHFLLREIKKRKSGTGEETGFWAWLRRQFKG